jgi:hypothetical protein
MTKIAIPPSVKVSPPPVAKSFSIARALRSIEQHGFLTGDAELQFETEMEARIKRVEGLAGLRANVSSHGASSFFVPLQTRAVAVSGSGGSLYATT